MKRILFALLIFTLILATGCQKGTKQPEIVPFQMAPSTDGVDLFLELADDFDHADAGSCYAIAPSEISAQYGFYLFKFDGSCASYLLYENIVYPLGEWFGGYGATSFAIADLSGDGKPELYFTCSWGSGIHRSQVGYFDPADRQVLLFPFSDIGHDLVLAPDKDGILTVYRAAECDARSFVEIALSAGEKAASIHWEGERITLKSDWKQ